PTLAAEADRLAAASAAAAHPGGAARRPGAGGDPEDPPAEPGTAPSGGGGHARARFRQVGGRAPGPPGRGRPPAPRRRAARGLRREWIGWAGAAAPGGDGETSRPPTRSAIGLAKRASRSATRRTAPGGSCETRRTPTREPHRGRGPDSAGPPRGTLGTNPHAGV